MLNLTGSGTITVKATGYNGEDASAEVTSSTDATDFADATSTAVVAASAFSGSAVGDLVQLNIVGAPAAVATQAGTGYDQYQAYMTNLTPLEQTSGLWLVAVTDDILANGLAVKAVIK